jgi:hypothetical protein
VGKVVRCLNVEGFHAGNELLWQILQSVVIPAATWPGFTDDLYLSLWHELQSVGVAPE